MHLLLRSKHIAPKPCIARAPELVIVYVSWRIIRKASSTVRLEKIAATELLEHALSDDFFEISNKIAYDRALTFFSVVS
jgi:hypothetical protein